MLQRPQSIAKVLLQILEPGHTSRIVGLFRKKRETSEGGAGNPSRLLQRHSVGKVFFYLLIEMELQFLAESKITCLLLTE